MFQHYLTQWRRLSWSRKVLISFQSCYQIIINHFSQSLSPPWRQGYVRQDKFLTIVSVPQRLWGGKWHACGSKFLSKLELQLKEYTFLWRKLINIIDFTIEYVNLLFFTSAAYCLQNIENAFSSLWWITEKIH